MALQLGQLIAPGGDIERAMFPDDSADQLNARVTTWLNEADSRTGDITDTDERDAANKAYVNYRAFRAVYLRLSAMPTSVSITDEGSHSYTAEQAVRFGKLADEAYAEFLEYVPETVVGTATIAIQPGVVSCDTIVRF